MPVMMTSEVAGQTPQGYEAMLQMLGDAMRRSPGFVMHTAYPVADGYRIVEIWNSREDAARFFSSHVAPRLPDGVHPKLTFQPLHGVLREPPELLPARI
jgi:hypothetical protein